MTLEELIKLIKERPGAFFGDKKEATVEAINHFCAGYIFTKTRLLGYEKLNSFEKTFRGRFSQFILGKFNLKEQIPWYNVIKGIAQNDEAAAELFYDLFDEFRELFYNGKIKPFDLYQKA